MMEILKHPVTERSAWMAADWAGDDSWIFRFSRTQLAELEAASQDVRRRKLAAGEFGKDDFPLPTLEPRLEEIQEELENGRGFVLLRGLSTDDYDVDSLKILYWGIGAHLGEAISQNAKGDLICHVTDLGFDYDRLNVRGYTTGAALAPHTDSPSDVVGLLCVHPAKSGGTSVIASAVSIYNRILRDRPEYLEVVAEGFHHDLRGEGPTGEDSEITENRIPVFSYFAGRLSCNFNSKTALSVPAKTDVPLSALQHQVMDYVEALAARPEFRIDMDFQPGDIQFLHNYSVMHWRTAFTDHPEPERKRLLLRLWLNLPNGRPLAPEFSHRFNVGPRQGVPVKAGHR